nr:hypothetical protein [Tanacetum cinerariifolium]
MSTPTFAKTHNLIAYLEKPIESEGFAQINDFLNGSSVMYAVTASPISILHALSNFEHRLKSRRSMMKLGFKPQLMGKGAKTTSWNEFGSTMASAIIYLATNQKYNSSRYNLLNLVKNIEAGVPFFIFPRFVQLIINHQLGNMAHHKEIFDTPSLTKKVFANMKRVGTGFSREVTLLFDNMLVQAPEEVGFLQADAQSIPITTEPSSSKPQRKHKPKMMHTQEFEVPPTESSVELTLLSPSNDPLTSGEDSLKLNELNTYFIKHVYKISNMFIRLN